MTGPVRVLVADDHPLYLDGLVAAVESAGQRAYTRVLVFSAWLDGPRIYEKASRTARPWSRRRCAAA